MAVIVLLWMLVRSGAVVTSGAVLVRSGLADGSQHGHLRQRRLGSHRRNGLRGARCDISAVHVSTVQRCRRLKERILGSWRVMRLEMVDPGRGRMREP